MKAIRSTGWVSYDGAGKNKWVGWVVLHQAEQMGRTLRIAGVATEIQARALVKRLNALPGLYWCEWFDTSCVLDSETLETGGAGQIAEPPAEGED